MLFKANTAEKLLKVLEKRVDTKKGLKVFRAKLAAYKISEIFHTKVSVKVVVQIIQRNWKIEPIKFSVLTNLRPRSAKKVLIF